MGINIYWNENPRIGRNADNKQTNPYTYNNKWAQVSCDCQLTPFIHTNKSISDKLKFYFTIIAQVLNVFVQFVYVSFDCPFALLDFQTFCIQFFLPFEQCRLLIVQHLSISHSTFIFEQLFIDWIDFSYGHLFGFANFALLFPHRPRLLRQRRPIITHTIESVAQ